MTYDIRGVVAAKKHLEVITAGDDRLSVVELGYAPFALLPLTDNAALACLEKWGANFVGEDVNEFLDRAISIQLIKRMADAASGAPIALVESHFSGGTGAAIGLVVGLGVPRVFDRTNDDWPDTNISMALKAIGVPERLDLRLDAFDVVRLGRKRSTQRWLLPDEPWEKAGV